MITATAVALIVDPDLIERWQAERVPVDFSPYGEPAVDYEIAGADATGWSWPGSTACDPTRVCDVVDPTLLRAAVSAARRGGAVVELVALEPRVSHAERLRRALAAGGGEVPFAGATAIAVPVPTPGALLSVSGVALDEPAFRGRWETLTLSLAQGLPTESSSDPASERALGEVTVAHGLLQIIDPAALPGFVNRPEFGRLLRTLRAQPDGAGTLEFIAAGQPAAPRLHTVVVDTRWGSGAYPVSLLCDDAGQPVAVRVTLGDDTRRDALRLEHLRASGAVVSCRILDAGRPASLLYRHQPECDDDSGWCMLAGDEPPGYADDPRNFRVTPVRALLLSDPELESVLLAPPGSAFARRDEDGRLVPVDLDRGVPLGGPDT